MAQCNAVKANGMRCQVQALPSKPTRWGHDPNQTAARQRNAQKAGRTGGLGRLAGHGEIKEIKTHTL
jgi:hypothetical protein